MKTLAVIAITKAGAALAKKLAGQMPDEAELYLPPKYIGPGVEAAALSDDMAADAGRLFGEYRGLVFIMAAGIVVRLIAPHIVDKRTDPAVVVVDDAGRHAISLLSGHVGGANELAERVAGLIYAVPVITTASDAGGKLAVDTLAAALGCEIEDWDAAKRVTAAILNGESVSVYCQMGLELLAEKLPALPDNLRLYNSIEDLIWPERAASIIITHRLLDEYADRLGTAAVLRPKSLVVGIGCNRGTSAREIEGLFDATLKEEGLSARSVRNLATIREKSDEQGLLKFAMSRGLGIEFMDKDALAAAPTPSGRSDAVHRNMGVYGVCEPAALISAHAVRLAVMKKKSKNATIAVAVAENMG